MVATCNDNELVLHIFMVFPKNLSICWLWRFCLYWNLFLCYLWATFNQTLMGWCLWVPFQKLIGYHKLSPKRATISEYWTDSFIWNYLTNFPDFELAWLKSGWAVMYCPASTVHLLAILIFIFCWKYWDNMNQTWQERSLGCPHSKLNLTPSKMATITRKNIKLVKADL